MNEEDELITVMKCLRKLGEKYDEDTYPFFERVIPRLQPMLIDLGLHISEKRLHNILLGAYLELDGPESEDSIRAAERVARKEAILAGRPSRPVELSKEERISSAFVRWFVSVNRFTLDGDGLLERCDEAGEKFKQLLAQAKIEPPATDQELHEFFYDAIVDVDFGVETGSHRPQQ